MRFAILPIALILCGMPLMNVAKSATPEPEPVAVSVRLSGEPTHEVSSKIFGQFLERTSMRWDEIGPEAAWKPGSDQLQDGVIKELRRLHPTVMRFPGGANLESVVDWTELIDNSPLREEAGREEKNRFGYDEFFALARELGAEPLIAVNFRSCVWREDTPLAPERMAAGLVAYCNAEQGADLPEWMPDWPAIRAKNGHPEPYGVKYWQIGNEWVGWLTPTVEIAPVAEEDLAEHVIHKLLDMIAEMRRIDPEIKITVDSVVWEDTRNDVIKAVLNDERVKAAADYAAVHIYRPWGVEEILRDGQEVALSEMTPEDLWNLTVAAPNIDEDGRSHLAGEGWELARDAGWPVTMTEWNWNGWRVETATSGAWPRAIGAAGFLHAMMREPRVHLATQSMMLGNSWHITGVRVDPEGEHPPFAMPTGLMTGFYSEHHGERFLPVTIKGSPRFAQPYRARNLLPAETVAALDAVATMSRGEDEGGRNVWLHLVNRAFDRELEVRVDAEALAGVKSARLRLLRGRPWDPETEPLARPDVVSETTREVKFTRDEGHVVLPAGSVGVLEMVLAEE
jgi:alpha-N-arabinofuranosidase